MKYYSIKTHIKQGFTQPQRRGAGFTLVEIMVVMAILVFLRAPTALFLNLREGVVFAWASRTAALFPLLP